MISLEKNSGLPIEMRDDYLLEFGRGMEQMKPTARDFSQMKNFLKDPRAAYARRDVYHMYRDVALSKDKEKIHRAGLEYDITVIPPGKIGDEFVKTVGHYHNFKPGTKIRYPEVYEVIAGKAYILLQSATEDLSVLRDAYAVELNRGDKILVPPGYGHVTINPGKDVLVLSNWQPLGNKGNYSPYEARAGAAYYMIESSRLGANGATSVNYEFVPNLHYNSLPPLHYVRPRELPQYDLRSALPAYFSGVKNITALEFLTSPENFMDELLPEKLFVEA